MGSGDKGGSGPFPVPDLGKPLLVLRVSWMAGCLFCLLNEAAGLVQHITGRVKHNGLHCGICCQGGDTPSGLGQGAQSTCHIPSCNAWEDRRGRKGGKLLHHQALVPVVSPARPRLSSSSCSPVALTTCPLWPCPQTCIILIALGNLPKQLGDGRAHCFGAVAQVLGTFLHLGIKGESQRWGVRYQGNWEEGT